ncbi:MAG: TolC family protein [Bacteroidota bacterium]|nr:TolC family protein [Bacteroidota bacterium]MDX5430997.1 TolC family protein [Bacteroidota bacterium]MDX5469748.1 TolC family protein [Bacteroidota bacterium]
MSKSKALLLFVLIGIQLSAVAQSDPSIFNLQQAVDYALKNNPTLQNAVIDVEIARKKVKETTGLGLPQINASVDYNGQPLIPTSVVPNFIDPNGPPLEFQMGISHSGTAKVTASWLLLDGTYFLGLKAAKEYVEFASRMRANSETETRVNVTTAYYMALIADQTVASIDTNLLSLEKALYDTRALYDNGFVEKIDVSRLELQVNNLKIQRQRMNDQRNLAYRILKFQMGMDVNAPITLTDNLPALMGVSGTQDTTAQVKYGNRSDYQVLAQSQVLNNLNVRRYQMGYLPSLSTFGSHQQNTFATDGNFSDLGNKFYGGTMWGLTLRVPIFSGFQRQAQVQQARLETIKTRNDLKNMERVIDNEVFQARNNYITTIQTVENQLKNYELSKEIQQIAQSKFEEGLGSSLEVSTANSDLLQAETNYLSAVYDMLVAELQYKKALGTLK